MTGQARPRATTREHALARAASPVEQLLDLLGAGSPLAEDVIGDLAEEYALRRARDGAARARWWYAREAARAVPHLLRGALRHGRPEARARLLALMAGTALASVALAVAVRAADGPPARLVAGHEGRPEHVVISGLQPVKIPLRVLDARGHVLADSAVRYARVAGRAAHVSPDGIAQCVQPGVTTARATLGELVARVRIDCQPVANLRMKHWFNLLLGEPAQELRVGGIGLDGRPVTRIAAVASTEDARVATLEGTRVRPVAPGRTFVTVSAGSQWVRAAVTVFEPVPSLAGLRPDQRYVIAPVRLAAGRSLRWPLPTGHVWLVNQVNHLGEAPILEVSGPATCDPLPALGVYRTRCHVTAPGASVTLSWPADAAPSIETALAMEREPLP